MAEHPADTAELALAGCLLLDPSIAQSVAAFVRNGSWYRQQFAGVIHDAVCRSMKERGACDLVLIERDLESAGLLAELGGMAGVIRIAESVPSATNWPHYAAIVRDGWVRRSAEESSMRCIDLARTGKSPDEIIAQIRDSAGKLEHATLNGTGPVGWGELISKTERREAIIGDGKPGGHGLIRRGGVMNLISGAKSKKTWTITEMAIGVASGFGWLGLPVTSGPVLVLDSELEPEELGYRYRKVADSMRVADNYLERLLVSSVAGHNVDVHGIDPIVAGAEKKLGSLNLIILDSLFQFYPAGFDENDNAQMKWLYGKFIGLAKKHNCAVVVVHHQSKGAQADKAVADVGRGASAAAAAAACHAVMLRHEQDDCIVIDAVVRSFKGPKPFVVRWNDDRCLYERADFLDPTKLWRPGQAKPAQQGTSEADDSPSSKPPPTPQQPNIARHRLPYPDKDDYGYGEIPPF